ARVGVIATGQYDGDGKNNHIITTGLTGKIRYVRIWMDFRPDFAGRDDYGRMGAKIDAMTKTNKGEDAAGLDLSGSNFVVSGDDINTLNRHYVWIAFGTAG